MFFNISQKLEVYTGVSWQIIWSTACWFLWKWRNNERHAKEFVRPFDPVRTIRQYAEEVVSASASRTINSKQIGSLEICWDPPREGWVKLNTDGAFQVENKTTGCRGLLRDAEGKWIFGFVKHLGYCKSNVTRAVIQVLSKNTPHQSNLIKAIQHMLNRNWTVEINHIFREGNRCADWLAGNSTRLNVGLHLYSEPPKALAHFLLVDVLRVSMTRHIAIS